jgi:uncharacterized membrane protein
MQAEIITLRLIHIVAGIFWVGTVIFNTLFLMPAMARIGPAAATMVAELQRRRLFTVLPVAALLTILTGLRLIWIASGGFQGHYFHTGAGHVFSVAGGLGILGFIIGMIYVRPASVRLGMLGQRMASASEAERPALVEELSRLRKRVAVSGNVVLVMLVLAAAGMAVARYMW